MSVQMVKCSNVQTFKHSNSVQSRWKAFGQAKYQRSGLSGRAVRRPIDPIELRCKLCSLLTSRERRSKGVRDRRSWRLVCSMRGRRVVGKRRGNVKIKEADGECRCERWSVICFPCRTLKWAMVKERTSSLIEVLVFSIRYRWLRRYFGWIEKRGTFALVADGCGRFVSQIETPRRQKGA